MEGATTLAQITSLQAETTTLAFLLPHIHSPTETSDALKIQI